MLVAANHSEAPVAIRTDLAAIFVSLELSRSKWLVTSLSPGCGEKMSKHVVAGGDVSGVPIRLTHTPTRGRFVCGDWIDVNGCSQPS